MTALAWNSAAAFEQRLDRKRRRIKALILFAALTGANEALAEVRAQPLRPTAISIGWDPSGADTVAYEVLRDGKPATVERDVRRLSFVDANLQPSSRHQYEVRAISRAGAERSLGKASAAALPPAPLLYQNTFEEDAATPTAEIGGWVKASTNPEAITVTTERARAGKKSVKFDFEFKDWRGDSSFHNRTSIAQINKEYLTPAIMGQNYWMGISTYLDESWQPDYEENGEVIWQFHGQRDGPAANGTPPVALVVHADKAQIVVNSDPDKCYPTGGRVGPIAKYLATFPLDALKSRWVDWVARVKFSTSDGSLDVWKDGEHVVSYTGPTIYNWCDSKTSKGPIFGFGTYKWAWGTSPTRVSSRIMYVDEVRIGGPTAVCKDVRPTGAPDCK